MQSFLSFANRIYGGNSLAHWAEAAVVFLVLLAVLPFVRLSLARRLHRLKPHESPTALELAISLVDHTTRLFIVAVAVYLALKTLTLPTRANHAIDLMIEVALWLQAAIWGTQAARFLIDRRTRRLGGAQLPTYAVLRFVSLLLVWAVALLMLLSNLGVNITALVTSLGIGGVAFALAVQNVLGDILASLAIAWDKPFQIGDELRFGDIIGTVEQIGIKSTRLRSIDGEQIIIGNAQLLQLQLRNFGRALEQRTTLVLTIAFGTPTHVLRELPQIAERVVRSIPDARFEHCNLRGLGSAGLEFELTVFAHQPKRTSLRQVREQLIMRLLEELPRSGLKFASAGSPVLSAEPASAPHATQ
jgi:small-conductance mechanosensitive channel